MKQETEKMNEVTMKNSGAVAALAGLKTGLRRAAAKLPDATGTQYLRMGKDGMFVFGKDDNVVAEGTAAVVNVMNIQHGYSAWTNRAPGQGKNELRGEVMYPIARELPPVAELDQFADAEWKQQMSVEMKIIEGKHDKTQVMYKASSRGGLSAMNDLVTAVADRLDEGILYCFPVITIASDSYRHASYGKTYVPKFDIVGWASMDGDVLWNEEATPEAAPAAPIAPVEDAAPTRRRRTVS